MQLFTILISGVLACTALARSDQHVRRAAMPERVRPTLADLPPASHSLPRTEGSIIPPNANTTKFRVNGTNIPDVHFDVGESYAGLLPISSAPDASQLYFWFFPTSNPAAKDEILIWLNGGPGCSSLEGLLQENGPFLWQYGTFAPVKNPWSWTELTNVVWIEQPAGTGFSQPRGTKKATNEIEVAQQFLGFWKNFVDTFGLQNRKVYITGESYAGLYVPYISDAMHNASNSRYFNLQGSLINDPAISYSVLQSDLPVVPFVDYWSHLLYLNKTYTAYLHKQHEACGYKAFMDKALVFPPKGRLPTPPNVNYNQAGCALWNDVFNAATLVNPCFDEYDVATTCPLLWDVLGFPGSFDYLPQGASIYFDRADVKRAINAPQTSWSECSGGVLETDTSPPSALSVLPRVIEKNKRTVIGHGILDMIIVMNGTLIAVQNMTWNGAQGFSVAPSKWNDLYVPSHGNPSLGTLAGEGVAGSWHTERGLTFATVQLSGHMIPQYAPSAAFRKLEFLLGRISNLTETSPFTVNIGASSKSIGAMAMP